MYPRMSKAPKLSMRSWPNLGRLKEATVQVTHPNLWHRINVIKSMDYWCTISRAWKSQTIWNGLLDRQAEVMHLCIRSWSSANMSLTILSFRVTCMQYWANKRESLGLFNHMKTTKYNFGDPADPKFMVVPESSEIGKWHSCSRILINFSITYLTFLGLNNERLL